MIKELVVLASHLDSKGLIREADWLDDIINKVAQQTAQPLYGNNPINQPRIAPNNPPTHDQLMGQLNLRLKALRDKDAEDKGKSNHDKIIGHDYIAKGFGVGKFIDQALREWNAESDIKLTSKVERLGVGEGVKITWVSKPADTKQE